MLHEKAVGSRTVQQLHDQLNLHVRVFRSLGKDFTSSRITAAEVMLELFEFTFLFVIRKKWEEEVFLDDAKNSDLAWFPSFLKKQVRNEHSVAGTQLLGHPRLAKAIKTHANAEKVTTAAALEAKAESQSNSCAVCGGAHIILHRRKFLQATPEERWSLCEKRGLCFYCLYKGHVAKRCSKKKRCGKAAWNLKHHGLLHQSGTMGNLKPAMGGYTIRAPQQWVDVRNEGEVKQHPGALEESFLLIGTSRINDDYLEYIMDPSQCQIFRKLVRVITCYLRFVKNCRNKSNQRQKNLTVEELNKAELYWYKTKRSDEFRSSKQ
ncbi:hypothetical protein T06_2010 [Trichinella sp. T6]|nr:hypothetical protein T06_2010 [Trichinella sp. T6]